MRTKKYNILGILLTVLLILVLINGWYNNIPSIKIQQTKNLMIPQNPSELKQEPAPSLSIVNLYIRLIAAIKKGNHTLASEILDQLNYVNYPSNLRIIFKRMNDIFNQLNQQFSQLNASLIKAKFYVKISDLESAIAILNSVNATLVSLNSTLNELNQAYYLISSSLGEASALLSKYLKDLNDVYLKYLHEFLDLFNLIDEIEKGISEGKISPTTLSLIANSTQAYVGSEIILEGKLMIRNDTGLANKQISIYLENMLISNFTTGNDGSFKGVIRIPYLYKNSTYIFASYSPTGDDLNKYSPSISNKINLTLLYFTPTLHVHAPLRVYPAKSFEIEGNLSLNSIPVSNITVILKIFGKLYNTNTSSEGNFKFIIFVPENQTSGNITFSIQTVARDLIAPVSYVSFITVEREKIQLLIDYPKFAISGSTLVISGKVISNSTPLSSSPIQVYGYGVNSYTLTDSNGTFKIYINSNLFTTTGNWELTIYIQPNEAWISPLKHDISIFVLNPLEVFLPIALILMPVVMKLNSSRKSEIFDEEKREESEMFEKIDVSDIYWQATLFVSQITGKIPRKNQTIREYLRMVKDVLKGYEYYEKICLDHEKKVYGFGLSEEEIKNDLALFNKLREIYEK
jgi:hypothetical protein